MPRVIKWISQEMNETPKEKFYCLIRSILELFMRSTVTTFNTSTATTTTFNTSTSTVTKYNYGDSNNHVTCLILFYI